MSIHGSDAREEPVYLLSGDGRSRLTGLREHVRFLERLACRETAEESRGVAPGASMLELAACLKVVSGQLDLVCSEVKPALPRLAPGAARRHRAAPAPEAPDGEAGSFVFGATLEQIDALDRLVNLLSAHGDILAASDADELAGHTLPTLGQAIHDAAVAVRDILEQVEAQRRRRGSGLRVGVEEESRAGYATRPASLVVEAPCASFLPSSAGPPGARLH